jgi:hypothetical protein
MWLSPLLLLAALTTLPQQQSRSDFWNVYDDIDHGACLATYGQRNDLWIKLTYYPGYFPILDYRSYNSDPTDGAATIPAEIWFSKGGKPFAPAQAKLTIARLPGDSSLASGLQFATNGSTIEGMKNADKMFVRRMDGAVVASTYLIDFPKMYVELEQCIEALKKAMPKK